MTSVETNIGIYEEFNKLGTSTPIPPISKTEGAKLSYLLRSNVVDDDIESKQPLRVYVSSLLRTWETAFLLFLQFLSSDSDSEYTPVLVLVVSPFLREEENSGINASNVPGEIGDNIMQFLKFIDLYILLSNLPGEEHNEIKDNFKSYPKKINIVVEITPTQKLYIHVDTTDPNSVVFDYDFSEIEFYHTEKTDVDDASPEIVILHDDTDKARKEKQAEIEKAEKKAEKAEKKKAEKAEKKKARKEEIEAYIDSRVSLSEDNITYIKTIIASVSDVEPKTFSSGSSEYVRYSDTDTPDKNTQVNLPLPYALTPMNESIFDNFEIFSVYFPDIFNYLKWVIHIKKHPKNIPIFVVSHSGTMKNFLDKIFLCFDKNKLYPSDAFIEMYEYCIKTNLWSIRLNYMGHIVIIYRHGFTCDNMFKEGGTLMVYGRLSGNYSNLSMWGIFSITKFYNENESRFKNLNGIQDSILSVRFGFPKQSSGNIITKNEITCGKDIKGRFNNKTSGTISLRFTSTSSTNLKKSMKPMRAKSVLDSDIDKDIQELISIEFTDCPSTGKVILGSTFGSTFGCIKLSCVYNKKYVIIRPYKDTTSDDLIGDYMYEISFYDTFRGDNAPVTTETKNVKINNSLQNILEYEKILLYLFEYSFFINNDSIISNFNISSVVNILMDTTMARVIDILKNTTYPKKINVETYIYSR